MFRCSPAWVWLLLALAASICTGALGWRPNHLKVVSDSYTPRWPADGLVRLDVTSDSPTDLTAVFADGTNATGLRILARGLRAHEFVLQDDTTLHVFSHDGGHARIPRSPDIAPHPFRHRRDTENIYCNIALFKTSRCLVSDTDILNIVTAALEIVNPHLAPAVISPSYMGEDWPAVYQLSSSPTVGDPDLALRQVNAAANAELGRRVPCFSLVFDRAGSLSGSTVGVAFVGGSCQTSEHTGLVTLETFVQAVLVTAHEIGHLLGLPHDESERNIMNADVGNAAARFTTSQSADLAAWAALAEAASCLAPTTNSSWSFSVHFPESPMATQVLGMMSILVLAISPFYITPLAYMWSGI